MLKFIQFVQKRPSDNTIRITGVLFGLIIILGGYYNLIHQGELEFPDKKPKGREIEITYKYDTSGVMHCTFKDVSSDKKYEISLRPESAEDLRKQYETIEHIVIE